MIPKVINAAPSLEKAQLYGIEDGRPATSKIMGFAGRFVIETLPQWLTVGAMLGLIFGGCCSNVRASEFFARGAQGRRLTRLTSAGVCVGSYREVSPGAHVCFSAAADSFQG
jgi:UDP-xylose/UDP-N-acetylglucosamine transporter B4